MTIKNMEPIKTANGQMNSRGQVIIPKIIREFFNGLFNLDNNLSVKIQLMPNGTIELIPMKDFPVSVFMENDSELLQSAARAYTDGKNKKYVPDDEIDKLLKD